MTLDKVRENRLRRLAYRLGYQVIKSASLAGGESRYMVVPTNDAFPLTMEDVEAFLTAKIAVGTGKQESAKPQGKSSPRKRRR
jgi:hypothetical protein